MVVINASVVVGRFGVRVVQMRMGARVGLGRMMWHGMVMMAVVASGSAMAGDGMGAGRGMDRGG